MLGIRKVEAEEIAEVMRNLENECELEDREIWILKRYLGRG